MCNPQILINKHQILKDIFGFSVFRDGQGEVIDHLTSNQDCLVIMPTGGGKSICYQIPALMKEGLAIVISPLIALMEDQVIALQQLGVKAECIHSNHGSDKLKNIAQRLTQGDIKLLYVSPERFTNHRFIAFLQSLQVNLFAIDEAHCVSIWGNDFRPDYAALSIVRASFSAVPIVALTATADRATQDDICKQLNLNKPEVFINSFERENIFIDVRSGIKRKEQIFDFVHGRNEEAGIIYCLSRKSTESLAAFLQSKGISAKAYHAGMDAESRGQVQQEFQNDELLIICATIAFGMGIDKSNIKWIIHYNMPKNIESYYQEIGRAGRDGSPADAILFYSWADSLQYKKFIDSSAADEEYKFVQTAKLNRMWEYVSTSDCRTNLVLNYFGEYKSEGCGHCDNCRNPPVKFDGKIVAQKAISAVIRSKESLSLTLLIDFLRGSFRREITSRGLEKVKTFGVGRDLTFIEWRDYLTQLIDKGFLSIDYTDGLKLKVTPLSSMVLKDLTLEVPLKQYKDYKKGEKPTYKKKTSKELLEDDLRMRLISWRKKKATELAIAPYQVLSDRLISEITKKLPQYKSELMSVEGIGQNQYSLFGPELLSLLQAFYVTQKHKKNLKGKSYLETLKMYNEGLTPEQISAAKGVHLYTIYTHYGHLFQQGEKIELSHYITNDEILEIEKAIQKIEDASENRLRAYFKEKFPFYKVKMGIAIIESVKKKSQDPD